MLATLELSYKHWIVFHCDGDICRRALEFFCAFTSLLVSEYKNGALSDSLTYVVHTAYEQSLRRHHNWLMRGTFFVSKLWSCTFQRDTARDDHVFLN